MAVAAASSCITVLCLRLTSEHTGYLLPHLALASCCFHGP
jgi:hypothetical protein